MDFHRLFELPAYRVARFPRVATLSGRSSQGWSHWSPAELVRIVDALSAGLLRLELPKGSYVVLFTAQNVPEWVWTDLALQQLGLVVVPIHPVTHEADIREIFSATQPDLVFTGNADEARHLHSCLNGQGNFGQLISFERGAGFSCLQEWLNDPSPRERQALDSLRSSIAADDVATVIFTSGSHGSPKGVELTHAGLVSNIKSSLAILPLKPGDRVLSYLPLSHVFERLVIYV